MCGQAAALGYAMQVMSEHDQLESELKLMCACDVVVCRALMML